MIAGLYAMLLVVAPSPVPVPAPSAGASLPTRAFIIELGRLGKLRLSSDTRWGWPGLAGRGFALSLEPRALHRFEAAIVQGGSTRLRFEWITVEPSPDPRLRWGMGQPAPVEGLPSALARVSAPIPGTNLDLAMQRRIGVPRSRGAIVPTGAFVSGRF